MTLLNLDRYWRSNDDWYRWDDKKEALVPCDDAPEEAKKSYLRYREQVKEISQRERKTGRIIL